VYPAPKSFRPEVVLAHAKQDTLASNFNPSKNTFVDRFDEPNVNAILHTLEKPTTVYRNAEWQASLRTDRSERRKDYARVSVASKQ